MSEKIEELEVTTGQVNTPEPEPKKKNEHHKKGAHKEVEEEEDKVEETEASKPKLPDQAYHDRLKATFKRTED